jgi:tryptophan synthase alpha chain
VIQRATERALAGGMTLAKTLDLVEELRARCGRRSCSSPTPIRSTASGSTRSAAAPRRLGVDGVLALDLPVGGGGPLQRGCGAGIDTIFLVSPTTTDARSAARPASWGRGFSTASRARRDGHARRRGDRRRGAGGAHARETRLPVALGFGLSRPEHIRDVGRGRTRRWSAARWST